MQHTRLGGVIMMQSLFISLNYDTAFVQLAFIYFGMLIHVW